MNTYIFDRLKKAIRLGAISFLLPLSSLLTSCEDVPMPFNNPELPPEPDVVVIDPVGDGTKENPFNVAGVLAYMSTMEADVESTKDIYVTGVVTSVTESFSTQYGNASFVISDTDEGTNKFTFYRGLYLGNKKYTNENDVNIKEDDVVVICGKVVNFRGNTPETVQNKAYVLSINGKTVEPDPEPTSAEAKGTGTQADPYNVAGVLKLISGLGADVNSSSEVYVKGVVKEITEQFGTQFGNATFKMVDKGYDAVFTAYRVLYLGNVKYTDGDQIKEGDEVIVCGKVVNFRGNTPETVQGSAYLYSLNGKTGGSGGGGGNTSNVGTIDNPKSCTEALTIIKALEDGATTDEAYYVKGKITKIITAEDKIAQYKNIDYWISDGTSEIEVFRGRNIDNTDFTGPGQINVGDEVVVLGKLQKFVKNDNMIPEMAQGNYIVKLTKAGNSGGNEGGDADAGTSAAKPFTPAQANAFVKTLEADKNTEKDYYIKGKIIEITDKNQFSTQYGNCTFYISDDGSDKDDKFYVFRTLYMGNVKYADDSWEKPKAGDEVIICGKLVNYKGNTPETAANNSYIYSLNGKTK